MQIDYLGIRNPVAFLRAVLFNPPLPERNLPAPVSAQLIIIKSKDERSAHLLVLFLASRTTEYGTDALLSKPSPTLNLAYVRLV